MIYNTQGKVYAPQFVKEMGFNGPSDWDKAKIKILFAFPCPPEQRLVSSTHTVLYNIVKETFGDDVFVDITMEPMTTIQGAYEKSGLPTWYGWFSGHDVKDFDIFAISIAIVKDEFMEVVKILHSMRYPLLHKDRIADARFPLTVIGGVAADNSAMLDDVADLVMMGLGERALPTMIKECFEVMATSGRSISHDKMTLIRRLAQYPGFYYPTAYHYRHEVKNGVLHHIYEGHDEGFPDRVVPDMCVPIDKYGWSQDTQRYYPYNMNQRRTNVMSSWGCSGAGACTFSFDEDTKLTLRDGLCSIKEIFNRHVAGEELEVVTPSGELNAVKAVYYQRVERCIRIRTASGLSVVVSPDHDLADENLNVKFARDFKVGDKMHLAYVLKPWNVGDPEDHDITWLAGYLVGDGTIRGKTIIEYSVGVNNPEAQEYLCEIERRLKKFENVDYHIYTSDSCHKVSVKGPVAERILKYVDKNQVPASVLGLTRASFDTWFAGYVSADGTIEKVGKSIQVCSAKREFMESLQEALASFGYPSRFDYAEYKQAVSEHPRFKAYAGRLIKKSRLTFSVSTNKEFAGYMGSHFENSLIGKKWVRFHEGMDKAGTSYAKKLYEIYKDRLSKVVAIEDAGFRTTYNLTVEPSHLVICNGAIASYQCHEGNVYGTWRERKMEDIEKALVQAKKSSMGETMSFYSFNSNYTSDYVGLLSRAYKCYDKISVLNFRTDVLAHEPRYFELLKALGANGVSMAIEGWGEHIRNDFLNKNLSFEEIKTAASKVFSLGMMRLKMGFIETGYESKEDFEEGFGEMIQLAELRDKYIAGTKMQINITALVHYFGTPLYKYPRVMPYYSWLDYHGGNDYHFPYHGLMDRGIIVKRGTDKGRHYIQQLVMDLGRLSRQILVNPMLYGGLTGQAYDDAIEAEMRKLGIDPREQFLNPAVEDHPGQHFELSFNQKNFDKLGYCKKPVPICVMTPATAGQGKNPKCLGCGQCDGIDTENKAVGIESNQRDWQLHRKLVPVGNMMDIQSLKVQNAPNHYYRFFVMYKEAARLISKENMNRRLLSQLQDIVGGDFYLDYRKISKAGSEKLEFQCLPSSYAGFDVFVGAFKNSINITKEQMVELNTRLEGTQLLKIEQLDKSTMNDLYYMFKVSAKFSLEESDKAFTKFLEKKTFRLYGNNPLEVKEVPVPFHFTTMVRDGKYELYFLMQPKANPAYIFAETVNLQKVLDRVSMDVVGIFRQHDPQHYGDVFNESKIMDVSKWKYINIGDTDDVEEEEAVSFEGA